MSNTINVEEILHKWGILNTHKPNIEIKAAIKEILDTALDECKKQILEAQKWRGVGPVPSFPRIIETIRNTINYE